MNYSCLYPVFIRLNRFQWRQACLFLSPFVAIFSAIKTAKNGSTDSKNSVFAYRRLYRSKKVLTEKFV
jgi:hypothetical protein